MTPRVVALSGGVGGAKLVVGLARKVEPDRLLVIANTGDDFEHLGLTICPDADTLLYAGAGLDNPETGWGRRGETWTFMTVLGDLGGPDWFRLGDGDLALHVLRSERLRRGERLSAIADDVRRRLHVPFRIVPASDDPVRTWLDTDEGRLPFQDWFVGRRCVPRVRGLAFVVAETATPAPGLTDALGAPGLEAIVICPSNPLISVAPILAVPELRAAIERAVAPIVAVSPLVGGRALKGPAAKMMRELGLGSDALAIARFYDGLIDGLIVDLADADQTGPIEALGIRALAAPTVMTDLDDRIALAGLALDFARTLPRREQPRRWRRPSVVP
ncbi:MAG TPA: 2-phospho-L-lactate transferase [Geminicoccaceae bacterium]|nr:2-phospho-L-lactate transferase [Geminicoccaceae bacterium]